MHEQKFKDLLSSTCQVSVERRVLDLESDAMRGPGSIPTRGNILSLDFISHGKASDANIGIIVNFVSFVKTCMCFNSHQMSVSVGRGHRVKRFGPPDVTNNGRGQDPVQGGPEPSAEGVGPVQQGTNTSWIMVTWNPLPVDGMRGRHNCKY